MSFLKPLFDSRRRTDYGYSEPHCGGANNHDFTYQTPPQKPYGGAKNHDYMYTCQTPPLSHTPQKPYGGGANHHDYTYQTPPASPFPPQPHHSKPPVILDDGAASTIEWKETPEAHIFKTHIPSGIRREDVRVQVEDDQVLKIIGEKVVEAEDRSHSNWRLVEVSQGRFVTSLKLPEDARADLIKSYWENGALTVMIPRREMMTNGHHHVRNVEIYK